MRSRCGEVRRVSDLLFCECRGTSRVQGGEGGWGEEEQGGKVSACVSQPRLDRAHRGGRPAQGGRRQGGDSLGLLIRLQ